MRTLSLRASLTLLLASAALLSFTLVATAVLVVRLPQVEQRAREQAYAMAYETSRLLEGYMNSVESQIEPLAHAVRAGRRHDEIQLLLDALVGAGGTFDSLMLVDATGRVEAYAVPRQRVVVNGMALRGLDLSANRLYRELQARQRAGGQEEALWSDTYLSVLSGQTTVGVALPAGRHAIVGELAQERLLRIMETIGYTDQARLLILDRRGRRLATSNPLPLPVSDFGSLPSFQAIVTGQPIPAYAEVLGYRLLVGGVISTKIGWVTVAAMPAGMGLDSYRLTVLTVVIGYLGSLLLSLLLAPVWAARLSRPFRVLTLNANRVANGQAMDPQADVGPVREFRQLARDLDSMVAALRQREAAVLNSEARLKATLDSTPSVATQWYDPQGRVLYWNPASTELYGYTTQEAVGQCITEHPLMYVDARQARDFLAMLTEMAQTGQSYGPAEFEVRHKDGRRITVLATTFAIPGDGGQPIFVCMDVDITQRKLAEQALRDNELKLETIFNASPAPMTVSDARNRYRVVGINRAWEQLFRRRREDVLGQNGDDIQLWASTEDRQRFLKLLDAQGRVQDFEAWCLDGEGRSILCQFSALITEIGGERLLLMMTVDITDRRRIERELQQLNTELEHRVTQRTGELHLANQELESTVVNLRQAQAQLVESEKLAALGNLVAGVAHELNTPIGNGLMAISTLEERLREFRRIPRENMRYSDLQRFAESVEMASSISLRNLQRATTLLSSFKQVAVDQTSSQRRSFELLEVVDEVLLTLQPTLKKTPYRIEVQVPQGLLLDSYPGALGQVLTNLVGNAVAHAFGDRVAGTITIAAQELQPEEILFSVTDDGLGIPEALRKKIFEPFFTTKLGRGGTGLGLHIVFNAVTRVLGGQINLRSRVRKGSTFEVRIPRVAPSTEVDTAQTAAFSSAS